MEAMPSSSCKYKQTEWLGAPLTVYWHPDLLAEVTSPHLEVEASS